jgi:hypothetical protein
MAVFPSKYLQISSTLAIITVMPVRPTAFSGFFPLRTVCDLFSHFSLPFQGCLIGPELVEFSELMPAKSSSVNK